jgi:hypothetical protein
MADIKTYGQLRQAIKDIIKKQKLQKVGDVSVDTIIGALPILGNIKSGLDFVNAFVKAPDTQKTQTWLDKLQVDDEMSAIVDDTVENGFIKLMTASIEKEPDDKPLEPDFNMNAKMVNYLKNTYKGRTIAGIKENKEVNKLKEYIKTLVRELLDEESVSGDAGAYSTPFAFAKKGQKTNAAIKTAQSQGMKLAPTGMPSDSKIKDYKAIWKSAEKPSYKMYKESLEDIIKEELLKEGTYKQFKSDVKYRTKAEQLHKAMREVKRKINEIDRIVDYTQRMKQELSEGDGVQYWGRTEKAVAQISEMVNHLNTKINNLKQ